MSASYIYYYFDKNGALKEQKRKLEQQQREAISLTKFNIFREAGAEIRKLENELNILQLQVQAQGGGGENEVNLLNRIRELEQNIEVLKREQQEKEYKREQQEVAKKQQKELNRKLKEQAKEKAKTGKEEAIERKGKGKEAIKRYNELSRENFVAIYIDIDNNTVILFKKLDDFLYIFSGPNFTISENKKMLSYKIEDGGENLPSAYHNVGFYTVNVLKLDKIPGYKPEKTYRIHFQFFPPPTKEVNIYVGFAQKGVMPMMTNVKQQRYVSLSSWNIITKIYEGWKIITI